MKLLISLLTLTIFLAFSIYYGFFSEFPYVEDIFKIIFIMLCAELIIRLTSPLLLRGLKKLHKEDRLMVAKIWSYIIWGVALIIIVASLTRSLTAIGLSIGLFSAGISFALQRPILCLVSWLIILVKRPFKIGDRIIVGKVKGDVVDITVFYTVLKEVGAEGQGEDITGKTITLPNSVLLEKEIINYSYDLPYVWDEVEIPLSYESDILLAEKLVKKIAKKFVGKEMETLSEKRSTYLGEVPKEPLTRIWFAKNYLSLKVRYVVRATERRIVQTNLTRAIVMELNKPKIKKKIKLSYPHTEVILHK